MRRNSQSSLSPLPSTSMAISSSHFLHTIQKHRLRHLRFGGMRTNNLVKYLNVVSCLAPPTVKSDNFHFCTFFKIKNLILPCVYTFNSITLVNVSNYHLHMVWVLVLWRFWIEVRWQCWSFFSTLFFAFFSTLFFAFFSTLFFGFLPSI